MNRRIGSVEADILEEFVAGLKTYFDKAIGKILLYRFERAQLAEVSIIPPSPVHKQSIYTFIMDFPRIADNIVHHPNRYANSGNPANTKNGTAEAPATATAPNI